ARLRSALVGGNAAAGQRLVGGDPRLGVVLVRVGGEAGERHEPRRRPFPPISAHLPAAERAVAGRAGGGVDRPCMGKIEIGMLAARRRRAPWPVALAVGDARSVRAWLAERG